VVVVVVVVLVVVVVDFVLVVVVVDFVLVVVELGVLVEDGVEVLVVEVLVEEVVLVVPHVAIAVPCVPENVLPPGQYTPCWKWFK